MFSWFDLKQRPHIFIFSMSINTVWLCGTLLKWTTDLHWLDWLQQPRLALVAHRTSRTRWNLAFTFLVYLFLPGRTLRRRMRRRNRDMRIMVESIYINTLYTFAKCWDSDGLFWNKQIYSSHRRVPLSTSPITLLLFVCGHWSLTVLELLIYLFNDLLIFLSQYTCIYVPA